MDALRARWIAWRNKRLADPRFHQFALQNLLFRPFARVSAGKLFDVVAGFVYAQVLDACVRLDILVSLKDGPLGVDVLAARAGLADDAMDRLLRAAAALDLVEPLGEGFALGAQGAALLGNPGLAEMIRHHALLYADLADPVALLRRGRGEHLPAYWPYAAGDGAVDAEAAAAYSSLMGATQPAAAADILAAYPMRRHRLVMDVGGGEGAFLCACAARWPHLALRLFDLPEVAARARALLRPGAEVLSGDFLRDPLPPGADLITFIRVLHDHDDAGIARLLASARKALAAGGRLLIAEPMSERASRRVADAYFGFYLLAMGRGRARSPDVLRGMLREAGFDDVRMLHMRNPSLLQALVAKG